MLKIKYSHIKKETEKAYLICFDKNLESWVPKKCCDILNNQEIRLEDWLVVKNLNHNYDHLFIGFKYKTLKKQYDEYVSRGYKMPAQTITVKQRIICSKNQLQKTFDNMFLDPMQMDDEDLIGPYLPTDDNIGLI